MTHKRARHRILGPDHPTDMTGTRWVLGTLLLLTVLAVLLVSGAVGLPWGAERDSSETAPSPMAYPRSQTAVAATR